MDVDKIAGSTEATMTKPSQDDLVEGLARVLGGVYDRDPKSNVDLCNLDYEAARAAIEYIGANQSKLPKHRYWGAGEADCPRDIKAGNGELHTPRCKVCGVDNPRDQFCVGQAALRANQRNEVVYRCYAWLGYWRDKIPHDAVAQLQDILGPLATKEHDDE